jgi:hypothetical protein
MPKIDFADDRAGNPVGIFVDMKSDWKKVFPE